jgi:hypothetical protein
MPTILRDGPYRFYFFSHEPNEPPHVHVDRGDCSLKAWLDPVEQASSRGFRSHEINGIIRLVELNGERLLEAWHEYFG